ncbi:MAG: prepilin-type N-terminal cleavage/methylation domain-containing protein [Candidatus Omnitrophica bacterium]|nr:prepilin-type N-terminal cleavage/methylation domain-containing protein [Candidatus Omnitrophota bacterium]
MRKGFTLIELLIVIIIVGVLATLGIIQYQAVIEKARGAEAKQVISTLRSQCAAIYLDTGATTTCTAANLGVGVGIPGPAVANCATTNYFYYNVANATPAVTFTATRCGATGKSPAVANATGKTLVLTTDMSNGSDVWSGTGGY